MKDMKNQERRLLHNFLKWLDKREGKEENENSSMERIGLINEYRRARGFCTPSSETK